MHLAVKRETSFIIFLLEHNKSRHRNKTLLRERQQKRMNDHSWNFTNYRYTFMVVFIESLNIKCNELTSRRWKKGIKIKMSLNLIRPTQLNFPHNFYNSFYCLKNKILIASSSRDPPLISKAIKLLLARKFL